MPFTSSFESASSTGRREGYHVCVLKKHNREMPPAGYSKPYPITKGLYQFVNPPDSSKNKLLSLDDETTLAVYRKQAVDPNLKKVVRWLREPLELFPKITIELFVTIESDCGIVRQLYGVLTIEACRKSLHCALDGLGVIRQALFHSKILLKSVEKCLNNEESNETDGSSEQLHVQVEKLKVLKENLLKLNKFLDRVLLRYSNFNVELPTALVDDIKHAAKKIGKVVNQLKPDRLTTLIPLNSKVTEEDVLCSVLGLNDDFADMLKNLSPEKRRHRNDMYFLLCFLKERHETVDVDNLHDRAEILREMGFTENRSNVIADWIAKQAFPEHKSLLAWAEIYIENLFKYDIFLNDRVPKFPYEESHLNRWFNVNVERGEDENGHVPQVSVINVATEEAAKRCIQNKIKDFQGNNPDGQLYFHGTEHNGAKNILEGGINLGLGKPCCDFSDGGGFYVADHFAYALDWAKKNKAVAVILFSISSDDLEKSQPNLDLRGPENRNDWLAVTKCLSSGEQHKLSRKLQKLVKKSQYIIGPISGDGVRQGKEWRRDVQQICIRKEEMADEVGDPSRIVGIVFLNTKAA